MKHRGPQRSWLWLFPWLAASCVGSIADGRGDGTGSGSKPGGGGSGGPRGQGPSSPDTGLWRLSRTEYSNTLHDLLGDTTRAASALDPDATVNGLDNNADLQKLAVLNVDRYDTIAADVVERALAAGTTVRRRLLTGCDPVGATCARAVVSAFARKAWRRPLESVEVDELMTALDVARTQGDGAEEGVKLAFRMALVSPDFLYRVEIDRAPGTGLHPV